MREERVVGVAWVETDGHDCDFFAVLVAVDKVKLCFAAVAADGVVGWRVDVPALEVRGHVVVREAGVCLPIITLLVLDGESWAVAPVGPCSGDAALVLELGDMVQCKPIGE